MKRVGSMYLFPVMQAFHVIFQNGLTFCGAGGGVASRVYDIAGEDFLPEGKAAGGTLGKLASCYLANHIATWEAQLLLFLSCMGASIDVPPFKP
jgi:hypothetical protein